MNEPMELTDFGWDDTWDDAYAVTLQNFAVPDFAVPGLVPARVVADFGTSLRIATPEVQPAELTGKMAHYTNRQNIPKVGDWVAVRLLDNSPAVIEAVVLPRRSELARKMSGNQTVKQVIAANVDLAFVLLALDNDFSIPRLERFLYQLTSSNIAPVIVLNKADKTADVASYTTQLQAFAVPIIISTALTGAGAAEIREYIRPGKTAILLGSSGVGKSTLTNLLLGRDAQATSTVRASDDSGRHTTVHRELFVLPNGGLLIDTPGIRELQLWGSEQDLDESFEQVARLVADCTFNNCTHHLEPGCAVQAALRNQTLQPEQYARYLKLKTELAGLKHKQNVRTSLTNKRSYKKLTRQSRDQLRDMDDMQ